MSADKNDKGEFALYDNGKLVGYASVIMIGSARVITTVAPIINQMIADAAKEGVALTLASGLRTWSEQLWLRQQNAPAEKKTDNTFLLSADSTQFAPYTGKPGWSNHQDGKAYDFNVTGYPTVYAWLVRNAYKYGFIRTVKSERWHWEYLPDNINPFWYVGPTDPSWDGHATALAQLAAQKHQGKIGLVTILGLAGLFFLMRSWKKNQKKKIK